MAAGHPTATKPAVAMGASLRKHTQASCGTLPSGHLRNLLCPGCLDLQLLRPVVANLRVVRREEARSRQVRTRETSVETLLCAKHVSSWGSKVVARRSPVLHIHVILFVWHQRNTRVRAQHGDRPHAPRTPYTHTQPQPSAPPCAPCFYCPPPEASSWFRLPSAPPAPPSEPASEQTPGACSVRVSAGVLSLDTASPCTKLPPPQLSSPPLSRHAHAWRDFPTLTQGT